MPRSGRRGGVHQPGDQDQQERVERLRVSIASTLAARPRRPRRAHRSPVQPPAPPPARTGSGRGSGERAPPAARRRAQQPVSGRAKQIPEQGAGEVEGGVTLQRQNRPAARLVAHRRLADKERPEVEVGQQPVEQAPAHAESDEQAHLQAWIPGVGQPSGAEADPGGDEHLVGEPRPHAAREQCRDEQRHRAHQEAEARAEDVAGKDDRHEDGREAAGAGNGGLHEAQHRGQGDEHAQRGNDFRADHFTLNLDQQRQQAEAQQRRGHQRRRLRAGSGLRHRGQDEGIGESGDADDGAQPVDERGQRLTHDPLPRRTHRKAPPSSRATSTKAA